MSAAQKDQCCSGIAEKLNVSFLYISVVPDVHDKPPPKTKAAIKQHPETQVKRGAFSFKIFVLSQIFKILSLH